MNIREELHHEWTTLFADVGRECQYEPEFDKLLAEFEQECSQIAQKHFQPWLGILEDSIQWLANLATILDRVSREQALSEADRCAWALVGAACTHAIAVRRLVMSGLDTPARAEARVLDEHLSTCLACLNDHDLAREFQSCQTQEKTSEFWYKYLNTKALRKRLNKIERELGLEPVVSEAFREWRSDNIGTFSQATHPTFIGAVTATVAKRADNASEFRPSFLGLASSFSERTLSFTCKSIWYFSRLGFMMLFNEHNSYPAVVKLDKEDEMQQLVIIGRDVLALINQKYWDYEIYPDSQP